MQERLTIGKRSFRNPYYDLDGNPIDLWEFDRIFCSKEKIIAVDIVGDKKISTIWLGVDYGLFEGKLLIFETMVFCEDSWTGIYCERYSTKQEAIDGHKRIVDMVSEEVADG